MSKLLKAFFVIALPIRRCKAFQHRGAALRKAGIVIQSSIDFVSLIISYIDFIKIGGADMLKPLFVDASSEVRWRTLDLTATLAQNHPTNQEKFCEMGMVNTLLDILDGEDVDMVRVKALYALSCKCYAGLQTFQQWQTYLCQIYTPRFLF